MDSIENDIALYVDAKRRSFSYDLKTDRLSHATNRLSYGSHTVEVAATDGGQWGDGAVIVQGGEAEVGHRPNGPIRPSAWKASSASPSS